jgi:hypothetical protein
MPKKKKSRKKSKGKLFQLEPRLQELVEEVVYKSEAGIKARITQFRKAADVLANVLSARIQYIEAKASEGADIAKEGDKESASSGSSSSTH